MFKLILCCLTVKFEAFYVVFIDNITVFDGIFYFFRGVNNVHNTFKVFDDVLKNSV